jgi:biotin operon repressor
MDYQKQLLSKNGYAIVKLSQEFLRYSIGDRIPTVSQLTDKLEIARGTIETAMKTLQSNDALYIESRGHLGSYLTKKNTHILLQYAGINSLVGAMPLPYSKKYEGLATGLISAADNSYSIPITLGYMRGAKNRIAMVTEKRYDFAVVSKYAAKEFTKQYGKIMVVKEFGPHTYCSEHVIIFHDPKENSIRSGMKIGIDSDSIDQKNMTERVCKGKNVSFIPVQYSTLLERVIDGDLDATVWNKDEIIDKVSSIKYKEIKHTDDDDTAAVIVTSSDRPEISLLLKEIINVDTVLNIQKLITEGKITPSY